MLMVCKRANRYGGKRRAFGDQADIPARDAKLVEALGWFVPVDVAPLETKAAPAMQTQGLSAAERVPLLPEDPPSTPAWVGTGAAPVPPAADGDPKPKREYKRRDMTAEP